MLLKDIQEAVKKNLSGEVGNALQAELKDLELLKSRAKEFNEYTARIDKENQRLKEGEAKARTIINREEAVLNREREAMIRERLLELKEGHTKESVDMMRGVVKDVFSNRKLKYQETITRDETGYGESGSPISKNININKSIEKEE